MTQWLEARKIVFSKDDTESRQRWVPGKIDIQVLGSEQRVQIPGMGSLNWGPIINEDLLLLERRIDALSAPKDPAAGLVVAGIGAAAVAVEAAKPVARTSLFNLFRRK